VRHLRIIGLALVAVFATTAVLAASASASKPEWGKCVPIANGKFSNAGCTEKAKDGGWEWLAGTKYINARHFTSVGGEAELNTTAGISTHCTSETAEGELSGTKNVSNVEVTFQGCRANLLNLQCTGGDIEIGEEGIKFTNPGEIKTSRLKGTLGYISGKETESPVVGVSLTPEQKKGLFAGFICSNTLVVHVGPFGKGGNSIIGQIGPVNVMSNEATQTYTQVQEEYEPEEGVKAFRNTGVQVPTSFEGKPKDTLETQIYLDYINIGPFESGQTLTTVNHLEEEIEIRA